MSGARHRYLVITELFLPTKGGTAVWFDEVYRRLGGKAIHIVTAAVPGGADHDRHHPNSIHRVGLRRHRWLRPESLAMYLKLLGTALALAARWRFDAVHAGRVLPEGLIGWLAARLVRRPFFVYAHGEEITTWRTPAKRSAMVFVYRRADRVIANSEFTKGELVKLGVRAERIAVIYPGVDTARFRPGLDGADLKQALGLRAGQQVLLSVGRLSRRKGFDQVIRALPAVLAQGVDAVYVIIGRGEDHGYLVDLARETGVAERVKLLGEVRAEDLARWYNVADLFVMPNREIDGDVEGFGMVFIEAAACAKPALAGRSGGTGAAVEDGVTGIRLDGTQVGEVAAAVVKILKDPELAARLGENGVRRVHKTFAWERVAEQTARLLG